MIPNVELIICYECHKSWVPASLSEYCLFEGVKLCSSCAKSFQDKTREPVTVHDDWADEICKRGKGKDTCIFLSLTSSEPGCVRHSSEESRHLGLLLKKNKKEDDGGIEVARSRNCSGPPTFRTL